ncbi:MULTISPECIES: metal ABC transporter permease [Rhodomicrobium]|uniref:metal ABC transporter permease n=1 Tax=Rhodomicrobium TaxID=1068 RepID=UPI001AED0C0A|nr:MULTISPECIES: metal ABC transporter permease [Rhodomicrobium]
MIDDFLVRAGLAGLGIALLTAPLGCFVVWQRLAMFGNSIAHCGLLGVALGIILSVDLTLGVIVVSLALAALLIGMQGQKLLPDDTLLGILAHAALAAGLLAATLIGGARLDLMGYLFGDILAVSAGDLWWLLCGLAAIAGAMIWLWRPLLAISVHEEMAAAEGVPVNLVRAAFMLLVAFTIALSIKLVGILLITSLLIIPAAAARAFVTTPEQMALGAAGISIIGVLAGLAMSLHLDTPAGPSIVLVLTALFIATVPWLLRKNRG